MQIKKTDLDSLIKELIFEANTQLYRPEGVTLKDERTLVKDVKFSWGSYGSGKEYSNDPYVILSGISELGKVQFAGDPFTYEKNNKNNYVVVSGPESLKNSVGKIISKSQIDTVISNNTSKKEKSNDKSDVTCPLTSPSEAYKLAKSALTNLQEEMKNFNSKAEFPSLITTGLSQDATEDEKDTLVYDYAVEFETSFVKVLKILEDNYSKVEVADKMLKSIGAGFQIKGADNNYCKFVLVSTIFHTGALIFGHPAASGKLSDLSQQQMNIGFQKVFNLSSGSSSRGSSYSTSRLVEPEGVNILDFKRLVKKIYDRMNNGKETAEKFYSINDEEESRELLEIEHLVASLF
jgi:hypothetical protein